MAERASSPDSSTSGFTLGELLGAADARALAGVVVAGVAIDSRLVAPGDVFFARPGLRTDGRAFAAQAAARGASAVVVPAGTGALDVDVPVLEVDDLAAALGRSASRCHGDPSTRLRVVGVTGTNGKTTVAHLAGEVLSHRSPCGVIGTLGAGLAGHLEGGGLTTPEVTFVQATLAGFVAQHAGAAVMEVSSHGIAQGRIEGIAFDTAVFTNLSRDHLDYHGDMRRYAATKARLFSTPGLRRGIFNADDPYSACMSARCTAERWWYTLDGRADEATLAGRIVSAGTAGTVLQTDGPWGSARLTSALIGRFNAANLLAALAVALTGGEPLEDACERLGAVLPAPGRMQQLGGGRLPAVVVDYSHTPDSLNVALTTLRETVRGELWCVFGCGGDRDVGKRAEMGGIAERVADHVVLTDDNPRSEASEVILEDILAGMNTPASAVVIADRASAIEHAIASAVPGDVVLVAGKGHEDYQDRDGVRTPFSDVAVAERALAARRGGRA